MVRSGRRQRLSGITVIAATLVAAVSVIGMSSGTAAAATPTPYGLVALWNMNDTSRPVMDDSSPNGFDGTIGSDVQIGVSVGGATGYRFPRVLRPADEPVNPERLAMVPSSPALNPDAADYAIEFRYRTTRNFGNIVQKGQNQTWGGYFKFEQPSGRMTCLFKYTEPGTGASSQIAVKAPATMTTNDGQWHTIRCELRRSFGVILFIDGVEAAKKGGSLPAIGNDRPISIGGKSNCDQISTTCDYFDGDIDYVRIEKGGTIAPPPPNRAPDMAFDADCDGLTCTFDGGSSTDPDGQIIRWDWSWGDGSPNTNDGDPIETHTFPGAGTYRVALTGTDDDGARDTTNQDVVVTVPNQPPQMSFVAECDGLRCRFDAGGSTDADGTIESYSWDLGDGATRPDDDDPIHNHTYGAAGVYTVTLTGEDDDGATATATQEVAAAVQAPTASFTVSCTELRCDVDAAASSDPDGTITDYAWTFGDGSTAAGVTAGHTFAGAGSYTIGLTVTDDDGVTAAASRTVRVDKQASLPPLADASRLVPLPPERVFDTRESEPGNGPKGLVAGGTTIKVDVEGLDSVPDDVAAVAINITAIAEEPGFITVWQGGVARPTASSINLTAAGQVRANLVVVPVGDDGTISLFSLGDAHLLGDIAGYFADQGVATRDGRIVTQSPQRLFDTRPGEPGNGPKGGVPAGGTIEVQVLGEGGLPATGVSAVVLTVTATGPTGPGFVTAWSGEGDAPTASVINLNNADETVPNQVIVPVSPAGTISFFSSTATQLLADVSGYVTDASATPSVSGLFVPLTPDRLFDTRLGESGNGPKGQVPAGGTITPLIAGVAGVPADAGAVLLNLTMIGTAPSFATGWPSGDDQPLASIVNVDGADVRANGATIALGDGGDISFFTSASAHLLADVSGYLVG